LDHHLYAIIINEFIVLPLAVAAPAAQPPTTTQPRAACSRRAKKSWWFSASSVRRQGIVRSLSVWRRHWGVPRGVGKEKNEFHVEYWSVGRNRLSATLKSLPPAAPRPKKSLVLHSSHSFSHTEAAGWRVSQR